MVEKTPAKRAARRRRPVASAAPEVAGEAVAPPEPIPQPAAPEPEAEPEAEPEPEGEPAAPPEPLTLATAASVTADIRTLAVNLTVLVVLILIVPAVLTQFLRAQVVIDPITVPEALQADGLTPEVVARRLWDGLHEVKAAADTAKDSFSAIPDSDQIDFSIPDAGLSIDSLVHYVRRFFNIYETRIGGEFRCADAECAPDGVSLRLRVVDSDLEVVALPPMGERSEADYLLLAATEVMNELDPFVAIAARSKTEPARAKAELYRLIAERHPDAKWAHNLVGNLLLDEQKTDAAIGEYQAALAIDPRFLLARTNLGRGLWVGGDYAGARAAFNEVLRADPKATLAIEGLADVARAENNVDEAIRLLVEAAAANPADTRLLLKAATIEYAAGRWDDAVSHLEAVLRTEPTNTTALLLLALHHQINDRYAEAEALYAAAVAFDPANIDAVMEHSEILHVLERNAEAADAARRAMALDPALARPHELLGQALAGLGENDAALDEFMLAADIAPDDPDIPYKLGPVYAALERWQDAIEAYRRFIVLERDRDPDSVMIGFAEIMIGKWQEFGGLLPEAPGDG